MAGRQCQHPSTRWAAARNFDHYLRKRGHVELVAAKTPRLQNAIEPSGDKLVIRGLRDPTQRFAFGLALAQDRHHVASALDDSRWSQRRLWNWNHTCAAAF